MNPLFKVLVWPPNGIDFLTFFQCWTNWTDCAVVRDWQPRLEVPSISCARRMLTCVTLRPKAPRCPTWPSQWKRRMVIPHRSALFYVLASCLFSHVFSRNFCILTASVFVHFKVMTNDDRILQCCISLTKDKVADDDHQPGAVYFVILLFVRPCFDVISVHGPNHVLMD